MHNQACPSDDRARRHLRRRYASLSRSIELFRAFRSEQSDPDTFYRLLAADSVAQISPYLTLAGSVVLDVGGGAGYFTDAFRRAGSTCVLVEPELANLRHGRTDPSTEGRPHRVSVPRGRQIPEGAVIGDGSRLPFRDACADVCFSSNVLEHAADPRSVIREMVRVTRPGGILYVSFTNWYSPWGGHETTPWHYLGGALATRRYERVTGFPPIHVFGQNLFALHVGPTLSWIRRWPAVEVLEAIPRYHPWWCSWVVEIPGLREVATWNLLLLLRRCAGPINPWPGRRREPFGRSG